MTVKIFADKVGVHPRTIIRRAQRMGYALSLNDIVPDGVLASMSGDVIPPPIPSVATTTAQTRILSPAQAPITKKRARTDYVHGVLFGNQLIIISAACVLISLDSLSFAWIAWNTYDEFPVTAAAIFAAAGMAVGYSAIKNFVGYKGYNGNEWMWGFGMFQCLLHLCAMEVLGGWSFFIGKIVISVGVPLATVGLAIALKKSEA